MYGTVAHWHVKPGKRDELIKLLWRQMLEEERFTSGSIASLLYSLDADPNGSIMVAIFDSAESYRANAASPDQHRRYLEVRELLEHEPEWNDGEIEAQELAAGLSFNSARYGTVAHARVRPGARAELQQVMRKQLAELATIPGMITQLLLQVEGNPDEAYMVAAFQSREIYFANAAEPRQHERYLEVRALLADEPVWHDGEITAFSRF